MRSAVQDMAVESLLEFNQLLNPSPASVGSTVDALLRLKQADVPVLSGFVISAASFQYFCRLIRWSSPFLSDFPHVSLRLRPEQPFHIQAVAEDIYQGFTTTPLPAEWLQTSLSKLAQVSEGCWRLSLSISVPQPWTTVTHQLLRMLPLQYCHLSSIEPAIQRAWASVFTAQTLLFMQEHAVSLDALQVALFLQPLPVVQASGFLQITDTHFNVQATPGLSEGLLRGEEYPDVYRFDRQTQVWQQQAGAIPCTYRAASPLSTQSIPSGLVCDPRPQGSSPTFALNSQQTATLVTLAHSLLLGEQTFPVFEWICSGQSSEMRVVGLWSEMPYPLCSELSTGMLADKDLPSNPQVAVLTQGLSAAIGQVTAPVVVGVRPIHPALVKDKIVVLEQVRPADWGWLQAAAGLICTTGGYTSHGAILARELGLPAIVGATSAMECLQTWQRVHMDGSQGRVYAATSEIHVQQHGGFSEGHQVQPTQTQLWLSLSQPKLLPRALSLPIAGVGLLRSEWFLLEICQGQLPQNWLQHHSARQLVEYLAEGLQTFVQAWSPRPVFYRFFDHKQGGTSTRALSSTPGSSPLGWRGVSDYIADSALFDLELQALAQLQQQGVRNLRLIVPFVRTVEEFIFCRDRIQAAGLWEVLPVWMMAEVPAVLFQLPEYVAAGVQGIAIGTNDLTQLLLGVDRDDTTLSQTYTAEHPAVVAALSQLVKTAQSLGIPCSVCGHAPVQYPHLIEKFVAWGVTGISVDITSVAKTQVAIATAEAQLQAKTNPLSTD